MKRTFLQRLQIGIILLLAKIKWKQTDLLTDKDREELRRMLAADYYIIASRRQNYITTFLMNVGHWLLTGNRGFFSHVLMNLEDAVTKDDDFRFIEATGTGTHFSTFDQVFHGVDAVALLKPKNMTLVEWTEALDAAKSYLGRPYDNLFDLKNNLEINCVELIRLALQGIPDYSSRFAEFERMIKRYKKLTPQMFIECPDFEVVKFIKR